MKLFPDFHNDTIHPRTGGHPTDWVHLVVGEDTILAIVTRPAGGTDAHETFNTAAVVEHAVAALPVLVRAARAIH